MYRARRIGHLGGVARVGLARAPGPRRVLQFLAVAAAVAVGVQRRQGWEWFELREREGRFTIAWRGLDAPSGEGYGGNGEEADPMGGCNSCHGMGRSNDYVRADALELPKLVRPPG